MPTPIFRSFEELCIENIRDQKGNPIEASAVKGVD
jgi:hypothetical protein